MSALSRRTATGLLAAATLSPARAVADAGAVDLQLVLAVDVSGSVTRDRFELQRDGYAAAFRSKDVQSAIANTRAGAIAILMTQWTGPALQRIVLPWTRVSTAATCLAFADAIQAAPRVLFSGGTSISGAVDHALEQLKLCPFKSLKGAEPRKVIDVSGDGENNRGRSPAQSRDEAARADITINGLPITVLEPQLDIYYRDTVIGGPGAFMIAAESYDTFADAVRRKLVQEIA